MTDDERMDRARRIREMREGSRPTDEAQPDDSSTADAELDTADAEPEPDTDEPEPEPDSDESKPEPDSDESDGNTVHVSSAEVGDVEVDVEEMARQAGLESATGGTSDAPADESGVSGETAGLDAVGPGAVAGADAADAGTASAAETRVLEFALGDEQYCLDIEYVEEIVKRETVTRVPNTPDCVEGVVDLRGQITTILDPKTLLDIDQEGSKGLIVVFDPEQFDDQGAVGWVVDDVDRVIPVTEDEVNSSPVEQEHVNGVVDRDGEFVIWTTPELDVEELAG